MTFEHVRTYFAPFTVGGTCSATLVHSEDYWRLKSVTDRNANRLDFTYYADGPSTPNGDLVAKKIAFVDNGHTADDTLRALTITATRHSEFDENTPLGITTGRDSGWRIDSVTDPRGHTSPATPTWAPCRRAACRRRPSPACCRR